MGGAAAFFRCHFWGWGRKKTQKDIRTVIVGKENSSYPSNRVVTSKYTTWNFLPKNLFEQFRRLANFYFLAITIISFIVESPVGPMTSILPLTFVVLVSMVKQGYEDFVRHRADRELNNSSVLVLRNSCLQKISSKKIKVGDIVKVQEDEDVPCDLVLLTSSHESSKCYVTTASLDGETNFKTLYCPKSLKRNIKTENLRYLDATIECENPTPDLYKFNGRIEFSKLTSDLIKRNSLRRQTSMFCALANPSASAAWLPRSDGSFGNGFSSDDSSSFASKRRATESFDGVRSRNSSSPQLGRCEFMHSAMFNKNLTHSASEPKRNLTLPKRALPKHKKSFSNVTELTWDPRFFDSLEALRWKSKRRGSEKENLVDPLTAENLLLKGSTLKNTEYIYGCAVYTGQETKMALNSKLTRNKFSVAEKSINKFLMFMLGMLVLESVFSTILNATIEIKHGKPRFRTVFVDNGDEAQTVAAAIFKDIFLFLMMYNYLVPISLYVTLEITKFLGALLFQWDLQMYDEVTGQPAQYNTSDLNEELGLVEYLFTDKTGTLTENNLRFHSCSIDGTPYRERDGEFFRVEDDVELPVALDFHACPRETQLFLLCLTLCNTVQVILSNEGEPFRYSATSPDEKAFVEAMQRVDIVFANDDDFVIVNIAGTNKIYEKLEVLEFSSSRKRMSVIVKDEEDKITLFCKGAESALIPKVIAGPTEETLRHVSEFAMKGLRTLVVGYKQLTEQEYRAVEEKVQKARETLSSDREELLLKTYEEVESGLTLLGATGVEDKLQEDVEDTLECLRAAGIKVWMLTGDKAETAVKISQSCGHFKSGMKTLTFTNVAEEETEETLRNLSFVMSENERQEFALVADGASLAHALKRCRELFRDVCIGCSAVVCCRLSPIQKCEVVSLVKSRKSAPIVAAIGDGANDVSMIKEAHVGLGIMGKEGRQAVICSDFAFAKFRFLKRALLVHGHWYYVRTANLVQYFFYKNIVFITPQFYFFFFSGFSVQQLYDSIFYAFYNTILTSLPALVYGVFEQNYPQEKLLSAPRLYGIHRRNAVMTWKFFCIWLLLGLWHSLVVFFVPTLYHLTGPSDAAHECLENYGTTVIHNAVMVVNLKLLLHSRFWSLALVASVLLSVFVMFLVTIIYSSIHMPLINISFYKTFNQLIQSPNYWLLCIFVWVVSLLPDVLVNVYLNMRLWQPKYESLEKRSTKRGSSQEESAMQFRKSIGMTEM